MSSRLLAALSLLFAGCLPRAADPGALAAHRLQELDALHGFQNLTFNRRCDDQVRPGGGATQGPFGFEVRPAHRQARIARGAEGPVSVGCYRDMLGMVEVAVDGRSSVRRAQVALVSTYGVPTSTSVDGQQARWSGERVEVSMTVADDGRAASVRYRSLLSEALWRRDVFIASRPAPEPARDPEPQVFRLSEDGVF